MTNTEDINQLNQMGAEAGAEALAPASPDINSLDAFNDVEEIDPNASITDAVPPPPAGIHVLKLSVIKDGIPNTAARVGGVADNSIGFFTLKNGGKKLYIAVQLTVDEEGQPYNKQSIRDYPNTMKNEGTGTTAIDTYLRVLTGSAGMGMSDGQKMKQFWEILQTEPRVKADIDWETQTKTGEKNDKGKDEYKTILRGMKNYPTAGNFAGHAPLTEDPKTGEPVYTRFYVKRLLPLSSSEGSEG